ncbi:hypothetical protein CLIB1423_12S00870 [[Candida] railenensis]|uniref:Uncharacterized protein n=1 Tax=[Candida] railenensis TaxID=45579 RepID=A0A9P0VZ83_9ASCO|nr:hypothetical protein CLIB1423_12S00870 [[Candida] railenensis]
MTLFLSSDNYAYYGSRFIIVMHITVKDLYEFRKKNYPYESEVNLKAELFEAVQHSQDSTEEPSSSQTNLFDFSNLVVDAETLEEQTKNREEGQDSNSEYAKSQREHKIRFRKEIQEKGLNVKNEVQASPTLNY